LGASGAKLEMRLPVFMGIRWLYQIHSMPVLVGKCSYSFVYFLLGLSKAWQIDLALGLQWRGVSERWLGRNATLQLFFANLYSPGCHAVAFKLKTTAGRLASGPTSLPNRLVASKQRAIGA
jgi:hypothetical protein